MYATKTPIYQTEQIHALERIAKERFALTEFVLMQRAAKAAFDFLLRRWPSVQRVAVFCGGGNNGGDGYLLAELLHERGLHVAIWQVGEPNKTKEQVQQALAACQRANIPINPFSKKADLQHPDMVIDAICGMGLRDDVREDVVTAIEVIEHLQVPVLAIDVPTGIDVDTGCVLGSALHATATVTFIGLKLGLLTGSGVAYAGEVICNDLQLPADVFACVEPIAKKIHLNLYTTYLKARPRDWHKGLSGHVLIVGGSEGYTGAPLMAAIAALRVGAGLVSVATQPAYASIMNVTHPEIMCHGITTPDKLDPLLAKADVVVIGPGLSQSAWALALFKHVLTKDIPKVIDADGLNLLAKMNGSSENWVLTPHPGEAARLLNVTPEFVQQDRFEAVKALNKRYGGVSVLKGSGSLVLAPNALPALCDKGNPGMASAGMGDVLSGVIGGLIAQGIPLGDAAKLGVCLHAMAGDLAAKDGERGMVATDLLPFLRRLANYTTSIG